MKTLILVLCFSLLACGKIPELPTDAPKGSDKTDNTAALPGGGSPSGPVTVTLTVYSDTDTIAPISGWPTKTYTVTGYCVDYLAVTYCWDDGMKTLQWTSGGNSYGPYTYAYFNVNRRIDNSLGSSNGGMYSDALVAPTIVNTHVLNLMQAGGLNPVVVNPVNVDCSVNDNIVTCPTFTIDTNQVPL